MAKVKNIGEGELPFKPTFFDKLTGKKSNGEGQDIIQTIQTRWESAKNSLNSGYRNKGLMQSYLFPRVQSDNEKNSERTDLEDKYIDLSMVMVENLNSLALDIPIDIMLSSNNPAFELDAKVYESILKYILNKNNEQELRRKLQKNGLILGTGIYKISVEKKNNDKAFIKIDSVDPTNIAIDPIAENQSEIKFVIEIATYSKNYLKNKYKNFDEADEGVQIGLNEVLMNYNESEQNRITQGVNVYQQYEIDETDPEGKRLIYTCSTDTQVLERSKVQMAMGIPYVFCPMIDIANSVFGQSIYEKIKKPNDELNILFNRISTIVERCANPSLIVNVSAGIEPKSLTNIPGQIIPVLKAQDLQNAVKWEYGPSINPEYGNLVKANEYWIQTLAGINDVSMGRGQMNSGLPSGRSIEEMSANAQTRLRQFVRNIKECYRVLGKKLVECVNDTMEVEEVVKITGYDAQLIMKVFEMDKLEAINKLKGSAVTEEDYDIGLKIANEEKGISLKKAQDGSAYFGFVGSRLGEPSEFEVTIKSGMDIKWNRMDMAQQATQLFQGGKIDFETYMDLISFPEEEKKKILEREKAKQQQQMQMQMMMQQQMAQAQMAQAQGQPPQGMLPPPNPNPNKEEAPSKNIEPPPVPETGAVKGGENI